MTICQCLSAKIHHVGLFEGPITSPSKVQKGQWIIRQTIFFLKNPTSNTANNKQAKNI